MEQLMKYLLLLKNKKYEPGDRQAYLQIWERKNNNYRIVQVETLEVESCRKRKLNKRETSTPVKKKTEDEFLKTIFSLSFTPFFGQI